MALTARSKIFRHIIRHLSPADRIYVIKTAKRDPGFLDALLKSTVEKVNAIGDKDEKLFTKILLKEQKHIEEKLRTILQDE